MLPRPVELVEHRPEWKAAAAAESKRLQDSLGELILEVHHVGSTAISGIAAKPIIDLIPVVRTSDDLEGIEQRIVGLGYECHGEFGIDGRQYEREKFRCKALHPDDTVQYAIAKNDWISAVLRERP
jgi:GrpB-like predicted nucleotidyltransferase (UPF0157 family)